jgi:hypothetical protein
LGSLYGQIWAFFSWAAAVQHPEVPPSDEILAPKVAPSRHLSLKPDENGIQESA